MYTRGRLSLKATSQPPCPPTPLPTPPRSLPAPLDISIRRSPLRICSIDNLHLLLIGAPAPQRENRKLIGVLVITSKY